MDKEDIQKVWAAYQKVQEAVKKKLDPVGKADADIDNDGDVDSSDEYLHKRRKAIKKAMKEEAEVTEANQNPKKDESEKMADNFTASDKKFADAHGGIDPKTPEVDGMKAAADTAASIKASEPGENHKNRSADKSQGDKSIVKSSTNVKESKTFEELMQALMDN